MTDNRTVWDGAYGRREKLWGGGVPRLPDFPPRSRVLELGCGNGKILSFLLQQECEVVGLDFSRAAVTAARAGLPGSRPGTLVLADARALPFSLGSFDAVLARHVIGHMTRPGRETIALEIIRVLRNGGTLHFSGFSTDDFRYGQGTLREDGTYLRGNGISTHYFSAGETRSLFSALPCVSLQNSRWTLRIRGENHQRSEIHAVFKKPGPD